MHTVDANAQLPDTPTQYFSDNPFIVFIPLWEKILLNCKVYYGFNPMTVTV